MRTRAAICTVFRAPHLNAYAERFVQAIQQECLVKFIALGTEYLDLLPRGLARRAAASGDGECAVNAMRWSFSQLLQLVGGDGRNGGVAPEPSEIDSLALRREISVPHSGHLSVEARRS